MASKYDSIKSAKELVQDVRIHGMSLAQEDICRAQDIFGHSSVDELVELANDNGRTDDNGKPDPNGSWSSGREGTQKVFYSILFHIWNWEDATRFWKQHTDSEYEKLTEDYKQSIRDVKMLTEQVEKLALRRQELLEHEKEAADMLVAMQKQAAEQRERADKAEAEVIKLKARLYDEMMKGEENG